MMGFEIKASIPVKQTPAAKSPILAFLQKDIDWQTTRLNAKKKLQFYTSLAVLAGSGVDLKTTLELISSEEKKPGLKNLFTRILEKIIQGKSLHHALAEEKCFTNYEIQSIRIGEETARSAFIYNELASFFDRSVKFRRQVIGAITYPAIMLSASVGVLYFMLSFVVPMLKDILSRFGGDLPYVTKVVVAASTFIGNYGLLMLAGVFIIALTCYYSTRKPWFRRLSSWVILRTPFVAEFSKKVYTARFCQVMHLLLSSRTQLVEALSLTKGMIGFLPYEVAIEAIHSDVIRGVQLHTALARHPVFSARVTALVKVAEEVNQLDHIFKTLGHQFTGEIEHQSALLKQLLEPVIILFLGATIGFILVAMYLPLFELSTTITP